MQHLKGPVFLIVDQVLNKRTKMLLNPESQAKIQLSK